jgi:phage shock protein PspC (stress-responsive transcriptional regulator)
MQLDLSRTWADAAAMIRTNMDIMFGLAGMFILLPRILTGWLLPEPVAKHAKPTLADLLAANSEYMAAHWPSMALSAIVVAAGSLALLALLIHRSHPTVADALRIALVALPGYILANLLQSAIVVAGLFALVLPGLYLIARLICIAPVAAAEPTRNPVTIMMRSFAMTRGNGWRILLLLAIILGVALVVTSAVGAVAGIAVKLMLAPELARLALIIVSALAETALAVVLLAVSASIYRQARDAYRPS